LIPQFLKSSLSVCWVPHYVFNTDVVVAAMRRPTGALAALLLTALDYEAACPLAESQVVSGFSEKDIGIFLDAIAALVQPL
jgi:hypothetical protein